MRSELGNLLTSMRTDTEIQKWQLKQVHALQQQVLQKEEEGSGAVLYIVQLVKEILHFVETALDKTMREYDSSNGFERRLLTPILVTKLKVCLNLVIDVMKIMEPHLTAEKINVLYQKLEVMAQDLQLRMQSAHQWLARENRLEHFRYFKTMRGSSAPERARRMTSLSIPVRARSASSRMTSTRKSSAQRIMSSATTRNRSIRTAVERHTLPFTNRATSSSSYSGQQ